MATLTVGPGEEYSTISAAVAASSSGDTIDVDAGTYTNDFPTISHSLTLQAVGGTVTMVATEDPANGKGIIDEGGSGVNVTISGFDISGAQVTDGNGAGVRYEGGSLTLDDDTIHNNQDGLLSNADPNGTITINSSTFADNGAGDGSTHNIYVGDIASLTVENSTITGAVVGHEIKSRAETTTITNNLIEDGPTGTASYDVDLPNGGNATITGNVIEKGPDAQNPTAISFGEEGNVYANSSLTVQGNTMLNDDTSHSTTAVVNDTSAIATITGNSLYGWSTVSSGPATVSDNTTLTTEPALSSVTPGGNASTAATGTTTTAATTPTTTSGDTSTTGTTAAAAGGTTTDTGTATASTSTTGGATGTDTTASTSSQGGSVPISTTTVGSSSTSPTLIVGNTGGSQGVSSTTPASSDTSGTGTVASLAAASGAPLDLTSSSPSSTVWQHTDNSGSSQHWAGSLQSGGDGAPPLLAFTGQQNASGLTSHTAAFSS